ncbi:hypothetical protein HOO54_18605 [Bacillus sp. WMMC1349]|uniref:hypothetical protein n=1 Tax=Bacillus sp. WMMC1349 TaxID=2736254 RepID=UPI0015537CD1|nr:hypothetical protein [Bacillus sp. WMMC1349]NPC94179.1 hypothetical protein [Bacillus sp. WMMC1349]
MNVEKRSLGDIGHRIAKIAGGKGTAKSVAKFSEGESHKAIPKVEKDVSKGASGSKTAEQVIADRTKGLDLSAHPTQQKQLRVKKMKELKAKIGNRTITKAEYEQYTWNKKFAKHRNSGVNDFWYQERQRILNNETPTRNWDQRQLNDILNGKKPKVDGKKVQGHHSYSASQYPHLANKGEIIYPATPNEHFNGWHGGN